METEVIDTVLRETLEEMKIIQQQIIFANKEASEIKNKLKELEEKLHPLNNKISAINLQSLEKQLEAQFDLLTSKLGNQPKNVIHKKQVLLFPEYNAREYYRIVFGRLFFWFIITLIASYLFALGKQFIDNWKEVKEKEYNIIILRDTTTPDVNDNHKRKHSK
jgi:hypothetical protein